MIDGTHIKLKSGEKVKCTVTLDDESGIPPDPCDGVECLAGEACDALTGECFPVEEVVPCVGIIDEWDNDPPDSKFDAWWTNFRDEYPKRPYCLLTPLPQRRHSLHVSEVEQELYAILNNTNSSFVFSPSNFCERPQDDPRGS